MTLSEIKWGLIAPTLERIGLYSDTALNLVTGTGLVESRYKTTVQIGGGPALGWFQMEPATYQDIWRNYLVYRPELGKCLIGILGASQDTGTFPPAHLLQTNPAYAASMCRVKYLRVPAPLPPNNAVSLSLYHKKYYNTILGKANAAKNIPLFQTAIDAQAESVDA